MYAHLLFFEKKSTSTVFVRFLKSTFNFTRSCAFPKKDKFYALKMLKNKISRILKLLSWQHCPTYPFRHPTYPFRHPTYPFRHPTYPFRHPTYSFRHLTYLFKHLPSYPIRHNPFNNT